MINTLFNEHCISTMLRMPDDFIHLVITSPPYDNLRTYGKNQTEEIDIIGVSEELYRVIVSGGIVVWIVNDATTKGSETGTSFKQALQFKEAGFNLHDTMIWQKPHFANPSRNRYHQIFEYMFIFSKGKPSLFTPIKDVPIKYGKPHGKLSQRHKDGSITNKENTIKVKNKFAMRSNVWLHNTAGQEKFGKGVIHPAQFPEGLIKDHIVSWSEEEDIVYDPFIGSGTTAVVAKKLNRHYIGSEINNKFFKAALKRLEGV